MFESRWSMHRKTTSLHGGLCGITSNFEYMVNACLISVHAYLGGLKLIGAF